VSGIAKITVAMKSQRPPTRTELLAAAGKTVPDVIAPDLRILFCGINPGLYSGAVGHHFARPGNRFWAVLHLAGFTERVLSAFEERELLDYGYGVTNLVARTTAKASALSAEELSAGAKKLEKKVRRFRPRHVAVLGITAYRTAFRRPHAQVGRQRERLAGAEIWLLPNPSGLNAHYPRVEHLSEVFQPLAAAR
jgi:TDG/mug DNA glycosylase family protein